MVDNGSTVSQFLQKCSFSVVGNQEKRRGIGPVILKLSLENLVIQLQTHNNNNNISNKIKVLKSNNKILIT